MTPPTTSYRRGDVVLVPFPFTDLSTTKQRPALVVSPDAWNASQADVMLVAITSQISPPSDSGSLLLETADWQAAGLPKPSRIRPTKLFTMHQGLIRRPLGQLPQSATERVLAELRKFLS